MTFNLTRVKELGQVGHDVVKCCVCRGYLPVEQSSPAASLSLLSAAIKVNHLFQLVFATAIILCVQYEIRNYVALVLSSPLSLSVPSSCLSFGLWFCLCQHDAHKHQIKLHCSYAALPAAAALAAALCTRFAICLHLFANLKLWLAECCEANECRVPAEIPSNLVG